MGIESGPGGPAAEAAKQHEAKTEREATINKRIQGIKDKREGHPYLYPFSDAEIKVQAAREVDNPLLPHSNDVKSTGGLTPEAEKRLQTVAENLDPLLLIQALVDSENRGGVSDEQVFRIATNAFKDRYKEFRDDLPALEKFVNEYINIIHQMMDRADEDRNETYSKLADLVRDIESELSKERRIRDKVEEIRKNIGEDVDEWEIREQAEDAVMKEIDEESN